MPCSLMFIVFFLKKLTLGQPKQINVSTLKIRCIKRVLKTKIIISGLFFLILDEGSGIIRLDYFQMNRKKKESDNDVMFSVGVARIKRGREKVCVNV